MANEAFLTNKISELAEFTQTTKFKDNPQEFKDKIFGALETMKQKLVKEKALAPLRALRRAEQERIDKIRSEQLEKQDKERQQLELSYKANLINVKKDVERRMEGFTFQGMESMKIVPESYTTQYVGNIVFNCYSEPDFNFEVLSEISKRLETRKLNINNSFVSNPGCDSCHHGREWEFSVSFSCEHQL